MQTLLCLDIGSGTQDVLLFDPSLELENCPKFVLPSPAQQVGKRIRQLTAAGRAIHLAGENMGGGFYKHAMAHLKAGLGLSAHPEAALALGDDLKRVEELGIALAEHPPEGAAVVHLGDYDAGCWRMILAAGGVEEPHGVLACAQDHGFHPGESNRKGRFVLWERFLGPDEGALHKLVFSQVPEELTRLATLQRAIGGGLVSDTGAAAVLGALWEPEVDERQREQGVTLVNVGNSHILAFLLFKNRMWGVYEHHTGMLDGPGLWAQLERFQRGELTFAEVFDGYGHGCHTVELPAEAQGFGPTYVLGPQRNLLKGTPAAFLNPGGDMMIAGCLGLIKGRELLAAQGV